MPQNGPSNYLALNPLPPSPFPLFSSLFTHSPSCSPPIDRIKLSQPAKDQLIKLKRITKIQNWNVLCRWALCRSLAEKSPPSPVPIPADSNVEMTWQVFGGPIADLLLIALKQRCHDDSLGTDPETLAHQLRLHLHRGIGYLAGDPHIKTLEDFISLAGQSSEKG